MLNDHLHQVVQLTVALLDYAGVGISGVFNCFLISTYFSQGKIVPIKPLSSSHESVPSLRPDIGSYEQPANDFQRINQS